MTATPEEDVALVSETMPALADWYNRPRGAHVTVWPEDHRHSSHRRPIVYRGSESGRWWVDDSGVNPLAWLDDDDAYEQSGFNTWPEALTYALAQTAAHAGTAMR